MCRSRPEVPNNVPPAPTPLPRKDPIEVVTLALLKVAAVSSSPPGNRNRNIHNIHVLLVPLGHMGSQSPSDLLRVPLVPHEMLQSLVLPNLGTMVSFFHGSTTRDTDEGKARLEVASCLRLLRQILNNDPCRSHPPIALKCRPTQSRSDNTTSDLHPLVILPNAKLIVDIWDSHSIGLGGC
jgi:hypothetical protein